MPAGGRNPAGSPHLAKSSRAQTHFRAFAPTGSCTEKEANPQASPQRPLAVSPRGVTLTGEARCRLDQQSWEANMLQRIDMVVIYVHDWPAALSWHEAKLRFSPA